MALNVGEANAVNTLLRWVLDVPLPGVTDAPGPDDAQRAAVLLAEHARKTLLAGLRGKDVTTHWPQEVPF